LSMFLLRNKGNEWQCAKFAKTPCAPRREKRNCLLGVLADLADLARRILIAGWKACITMSLPQQIPQERQPVFRQTVLRAGQRSPDGGGGGDGRGLGGEGLDDGVAVVVDFPQALGDAVPVDVDAAAGGAAVVLAGM